MASKLSITQVGVNQGLAQIKTGELFVVTEVDLSANKVTLRSAAGEEKVVSKATLERWYRELSAEEVVAFGKTLNNNGGSQDEVQESNEPEQAEEPREVENADAGNDVNEQEADTDSSKVEDVVGALKEMYGAETAGEGSDGEVGADAESDSDMGGSTDESPAEADRGDGENSGDDDGDGETAESEGVKSPVTPSNAGKDKDKAKEPKKQEPKNAALMKVRQTIIDTVLADSPSIQLKKTTSYDVLKEKHNFAEITHGSNRFNVSVMSKCLTPDQLSKVKVNPASFGWSIDADFTVFDESDIEMAVQLIRQSREYRMANPVTRKKKDSAAKANK